MFAIATEVEGKIVTVTVIVTSSVVGADDEGSTADVVLTGGITPEFPVPLLLIVLPLVANEAAPEVTEIRSVDSFADEAGGIMPEAPVDAKAIVLSLVANEANPDVTVLVTVTVPRVDFGGIMPELPVEFEASVLPLVAKAVLPDITTLDVTITTSAEEPGGMIPKSPVLAAVAVEPEMVSANDPVENMVELEPSCTVGEAVELTRVLMEGVTTPESPVDSAAKVLPEELRRAEPPIVEGGGTTPSLPLRLLAMVDPEVEA